VLYYFAVNLFVASKFLQGPLINDAAVQKVETFVQDAVSKVCILPYASLLILDF